MTVGNWDEIRTAYHVVRAGTVSGAAEALGVHHATVIRHIDTLESALGTKLFQRHARGYTATEAGQDLFRVAQTTEDQFSQMIGRLKGQGTAVTGELVVTSPPGVAGCLAPVLVRFQQDHPEVVIRFLTDERLFRLEYGEAHVAIRGGRAPEELDNVAQPFAKVQTGLYASPAYLDRMGRPKTDADLADHRFIVNDNLTSRAPFFRWLHATLPENVGTFRGTDVVSMIAALRAGAGLGFLSQFEARQFPELEQVMPPRPEWGFQLWLVTHVDLHRTAKVQAFLAALKAAATDWA